MRTYVLASYILLIVQNAFGQVVLGGLGGGLASNLGTAITGNSVVTNNIGIGNSGANSLSNGVILNANNLANNGLASGFVSNVGASNLANGIVSVGNGLASNIGNFGASSVGLGLANGGAVASGLGSQGISLGSLTNVRFGEVEYIKDVSVNSGYSGEYPVIGYVTFEGYLPASGTVSVANEGCLCAK